MILFCFVVKLDSPTEIPAKEIAFYAYMLVSKKQIRLVVLARIITLLFSFVSVRVKRFSPGLVSDRDTQTGCATGNVDVSHK